MPLFTSRILMAIVGALPSRGAVPAQILLSMIAIVSSASARAAADISALVRLTSNYEYRGYTLSDNHAAIQANLDAAWSNGLFLGSWVSSADYDGATVAANPYVGKSFALSPDWQFVTLIAGHFFYGKLDEYTSSYGEYEKAGDYNASYGAGELQFAYRDLGSVQVHIAPDYYGTGETVVAYELELRYPLLDTVEISAGIGYQDSRDALNHDDLFSNVGIAWFILPNLTLDLRYHDLHQMNERRYRVYEDKVPPAYDLDSPVILSVSLGF